MKQIFNIHDMTGINEVQTNNQNTTIIQMVKNYFMDTKIQEYRGLTSIKNYFGERWGFQYAFMDFYTAWLVIPAVLSVPCAIQQFKMKGMTLFSFYFAVMMSFWITIFIERWKRKENELRLVWGTSLQAAQRGEGNIRTEYKGNEQFNLLTKEVDRKDVT